MIYIGIDPDTRRLPIAIVAFDAADLGLILEVRMRLIEVEKGVLGRAAALRMAEHLAHHGLRPQGADRSTAVAAVEGQYFNPYGKARSQDVALLSFVSGAAATALYRWCDVVYTPLPRQWKGEVPKLIHQQRVARKLGWEVRRAGSATDPSQAYCVPTDPDTNLLLPRASDWKHGFDAIGLALWARDEHARRLQREGAPEMLPSGSDLGSATPLSRRR